MGIGSKSGFTSVDRPVGAGGRAPLALLLCLAAGAAWPVVARSEEMKNYESTYHTVRSDMDPVRVRELLMRMTYMAEEYNQHFPNFTGVFNRKYQVTLYQNPGEFEREAGPGFATSSAVYLGQRRGLLVTVRKDVRELAYPVQQMGFVQFCHESITNGQEMLPTWLSGGLGHYFGQAMFTGDGFVCGTLPPQYLTTMRESIAAGHFRPIKSLIGLSQREFSQVKTLHDPLLLWSLALYLIHGDDGRHRPAFEQYLHDVSRAVGHDEAWAKAFGEVADLEAEWRQWWLGLTPDATCEPYARAAAGALCNYLGRAGLQGQTFANIAELTEAVQGNKVRLADADWLPPTLPGSVAQRMQLAGAATKFALGPDPRKPQVIATLPDGTRVVATFDPLRKDRRTVIDVEGLSVELVKGTQLIARKRPADAQAVLQAAIRRFPEAPPAQVARARQALQRAVAATAAAAVATTQTERPSQPGKPHPASAAVIAVKSARFGAGERWVDVTERCRRMAAGDLFVAPRNLTEVLGVDSAAGTTNMLDLTLVINGSEVRMVLTDNVNTAPLRVTTQLPGGIK